MNPADPRRKEAAERVERILTGRLKRAGQSVSNARELFSCQADEPQPYKTGSQVRVHISRHWSDARVKLDGDTGDMLGYSVDRYSDPPTRTELTGEQALALAASLISIPPDAVLESFQHVEWAPRRWLVEIQWKRVHQGLRVDGDSIRVVIHPDTRRLVELEWFWRSLRLR
ncbi:MAG: hypothetical protein Q8N47_24160 [Bryobacterales bacterium]|nr:hypothetical protein [Bryobacterales bacterium]